MVKNCDTNEKLTFLEKLFCIMIVWGSGTQVSLQFSYIYYAIVMVFALMVLSGWFRFNRSMQILICGVVLLTSLSIFLNINYMEGRGISSTINNFIIILCSILFAMNKPRLNARRFEFIIKVILFFSFLSSVLYIFSLLGLITVRRVSIVSHIYTFYYLLNVTQSDLIDSVTRNGGFYWEPGMFQVFLNFILIYYLFGKHLKYRSLIIAYCVIAIVSTISVSGYALALAVFGVYGVSNTNHNKALKYVARIAIIAALIFLVPVVLNLFSVKEGTGSFEKRNLDLLLAWDVFLQHPILGHGIVNEAFAKAYYMLIGEERPSSNGLMNLLMGTGVVGASLFFYCYTRTLKYFSNEYSKRIVIPLLLWLVISINTEPIQYHPFINFLFGVGFAFCYNKSYIHERKMLKL